MADQKISALTSATTPLAGTEVLPVVQSGATKKVSVDNLTAGKQVPALKVNIGSGAQTDDVLHIEGATSADARQRIVNTAASQSSEIRFGDDTNAEGGLIIKGGSTYPSYGGANSFVIWNNRNAPIVFGTNDANRGEFTAGGDFKVASGNVIQGTAAKGVNFTANTPAAGMASQLLNWYEEGTWTPVLRFGGASTGITGTFTGTYTRVGNLVLVRGYCSVTNKGSATGAANINGLPFPVKSNTQPFAPGSIYVSGGAIAAGVGEMVQLNFNASGIDVNKVNPATGADANCTDGNFAAAGSFWFSAVYDV